MKVFKKYILPFLIVYTSLAVVVACIVYYMSTLGKIPMLVSDGFYMLTLLAATSISALLGFIVMQTSKNMKAVYALVSKQPLIVVCVGEGLFATNALISNLVDGLLYGSIIVIFPLILFAFKTTRDIKSVLS